MKADRVGLAANAAELAEEKQQKGDAHQSRDDGEADEEISNGAIHEGVSRVRAGSVGANGARASMLA